LLWAHPPLPYVAYTWYNFTNNTYTTFMSERVNIPRPNIGGNTTVGVKFDQILLHEQGHTLGIRHVYLSIKGLATAMTLYLQAKEQTMDVTSLPL